MHSSKPVKLDTDGVGRPRFNDHTLDQLLESVGMLIEQTERIAAELALVKSQLLRLKGPAKA